MLLNNACVASDTHTINEHVQVLRTPRAVGSPFGGYGNNANLRLMLNRNGRRVTESVHAPAHEHTQDSMIAPAQQASAAAAGAGSTISPRVDAPNVRLSLHTYLCIMI